MIDPDCDAEVTGITNRQTQPQVYQTVNTNTDSGPANLDQGLEQVSDISLNQNLGTLYNQDFFVTDTTSRRPRYRTNQITHIHSQMDIQPYNLDCQIYLYI